MAQDHHLPPHLMKLNIQRGRIDRPQKLVIYAPEGFGKSTLAAQLPHALFLDFERGTHHLDVARIEPATLRDVDAVIGQLTTDSQGFKNLVIDTIDWLEEQAITDVCQSHEKNSLEDFGYGKGYVVLSERLAAILYRLEILMARQEMNVICLAHCQVRKFELPEGGGFDRYSLKLTRQVEPLFKEWCDALLFGNYKTSVSKPDRGAKKGVGGKVRLMFCNHAAPWDAKNRRGLADEEPWDIGTLHRLLAGSQPAEKEPQPVEQSPGPKVVSVASTSETDPAAMTPAAAPPVPVKAGGQSAESLEPVFCGTAGSGDSVPASAASPAGDNGPMTRLQILLSPYFEKEENREAEVNAFLVARREIKPGENYRNVSERYARRILANPDGFFRVVTSARPLADEAVSTAGAASPAGKGAQ
jgi:hypothetical protein